MKIWIGTQGQWNEGVSIMKNYDMVVMPRNGGGFSSWQDGRGMMEGIPGWIEELVTWDEKPGSRLRGKTANMLIIDDCNFAMMPDVPHCEDCGYDVEDATCELEHRRACKVRENGIGHWHPRGTLRVWDDRKGMRRKWWKFLKI